MGNPMRIRANATGDVVEVKVLMRHDMETGQRKDASAKAVPAHFIQTLTAKCNDKVVLDMLMGTSISKDPFLSFKFKGGAKGDKITISWTDNTGDSRTDEAAVS
ncbi:thiosulfate oxidation carrier complex protein SoxZ [Herminiimonas contaminans]|uniref:Thiosulfate oxidation carrier complex protein SoxZ n=1 Tax=Herminiimonas contaminans TaxID=1111140 RepID=A0ABS0ERW9_9BURK|nr:thiosulfate oxidation carrier complex protein SoxZ [Herminiimonas contaminans]MBF8177571.1 thiosulfate oxidation carrier complex protein SoxZ [Herminiimonas contaminans]